MTILKGIPRIINPQLLSALARMGHGDEIVFADANFPSASVAASTTLGQEIRVDGSGIPELLSAVMKLFPLDPVARNGIFMEMMPEHKAAGWKTPIWDVYKGIILTEEPAAQFEEVERFAFYERSKKAFAVVATGCVFMGGRTARRAKP
jgi:L-fucose mutarotase